MARIFRARARNKRVVLGATSLSAAAVVMIALVSSGTAYADTVLPGQAGSYQVAASSAGLYLALAGTQLTGGTSSVTGHYNGVGNEQATATAEGFLLSNQLTGTGPSVSVDNTKGAPYSASGVQGTKGDPLVNGGNYSNVDVGGPSTPPDCFQGGGGGQQGVGVFLGLGCGFASATVDSPTSATPVGPQALGAANIAQVHVDLAGILNQVYNGGVNQLCNGLNQIPQLGSDLLGPACTQALSAVNPSVEVDVGNAYSEIVGTATQVFAKSSSSSIDVSLLPGTAANATPFAGPLLRVQIPSATAESCEGTPCTPVGPAACTSNSSSAGWTNSYDATLIKISGTLIDGLNKLTGSSFPDPLEIPPCGSGTSQLAQLAGPGVGPLCTNGLLCLTLASANTSGSGVLGSGAELTLLPGQVQGNPLLEVNTSGIKTTASGSGVGPATTPQSSPPAPGPGPGPGLPPVSTQAATSPTAVHTGEWWSGSLPLLAILAALGGGLLGWPRVRRFPLVSRLIARSSR